MPAFDFSGIGVKAKASQDYGFLVDQLDIKRNQLESDGKLSPGDYDVLIKQARTIASSPALSPEQRSNVLVKISQYDQEKKNTRQKDLNDIKRLNNGVQDDERKNVMLFGNNPQVLLQANADALRMKIDSLSQSIDQLNYSGDDPSGHINEYTDTLQKYNDTLQALDDVKNHKPGEKSNSGFAAYIITNSSGEITDVQVDRVGSKTGYEETNGSYGGLQIYGKVNQKQNGKKIFKLGNDTFSGSDFMLQDPNNPMLMRSAPLLSDDVTKNSKNPYMVVPDILKEVDLTKVNPQRAIRAGGFAQSSNGFLYERLPSGQYKKYTNTTPEKLGIPETNIIKIPQSMEQSLIPSVTETVDGSAPFIPPMSSAQPVVPNTTSTQQQTAQAQQNVATGTSRTPSPTVRAPQSAGGIASKALNFGKGVLNYLFGGGE